MCQEDEAFTYMYCRNGVHGEDIGTVRYSGRRTLQQVYT